MITHHLGAQYISPSFIGKNVGNIHILQWRSQATQVTLAQLINEHWKGMVTGFNTHRLGAKYISFYWQECRQEHFAFWCFHYILDGS